MPRNAIRIEQFWERLLTERSTLGLGYEYRRARFDGNSSGLVDYDQDTLDAFYSYQLTERLALRGTLGATFYDPDDAQSYKGYQALLGVSYALSETLAGGLDLGWQRIDRETDLGIAMTEGTASGTVYDLNLSKEFTRSRLSIAVRRSAVPTGSAEPLVQESLNLGYVYEFSPRLRLNIPVAVFRNEVARFDDIEGDDERRIFFSTQPSLNWRISEDLVFSASYRYRYQRVEEEGTSAGGNAVFLSLSYVWPTEIPGFSR